MLRAMVCGVLGLALCVGGLQAADKAKDAKAAKDSKTDAKGIPVTVKSVDAAKGTMTVTTKSGKTMVLKVDKGTRVVGPRGGKSDKGLKDDRLAAGAMVSVVLGADDKTVKEIKLGFRKRGGGAKVKEKAPDKK